MLKCAIVCNKRVLGLPIQVVRPELYFTLLAVVRIPNLPTDYVILVQAACTIQVMK